MPEHTQESTLSIQGFTTYAQVPAWIIRSGKNLSHGARSVYSCIMTYADNSTKTAFPSRSRLAEDLGCTEKSISRYIKELENYGALLVTRRRNKRTGNFYANDYTLVFDEPRDKKGTRPEDKKDAPPKVENVPITTLTSLTRSTRTTPTHSAYFVGGEPQALSKLGLDTFPQGYSQAEWEADIAEVGRWGS